MDNTDTNFIPGLITGEMIAPGAVTQRHLYPGNSNIGDLYYGKDGVRFSELTIGTSGQVLTVTSGVPTWQTVSSSPTLNNPTINGSLQGVIALTGTTPNIDLTAQANIFTLLLTGDTTFTATSNTKKIFMVEVQQDASTAYTTTWFSGITWVTSGGTAPTMTSTLSGYTTFGFRCTALNTYLGYLIGSN